MGGVLRVNAGKMWHDPRADGEDLRPLGVGFARWYLDWLEKAEATRDSPN